MLLLRKELTTPGKQSLVKKLFTTPVAKNLFTAPVVKRLFTTPVAKRLFSTPVAKNLFTAHLFAIPPNTHAQQRQFSVLSQAEMDDQFLQSISELARELFPGQEEDAEPHKSSTQYINFDARIRHYRELTIDTCARLGKQERNNLTKVRPLIAQHMRDILGDMRAEGLTLQDALIIVETGVTEHIRVLRDHYRRVKEAVKANEAEKNKFVQQYSDDEWHTKLVPLERLEVYLESKGIPADRKGRFPNLRGTEEFQDPSEEELKKKNKKF